MEYFTIYRTHDSAELSIIKHKFEEEKLNYQILDEHTNSSAGVAGMGGEGMRIQVQESQVDKAKTILKEIGFLKEWKDDSKQRRSQPARKWIFIFLAALVLIIVAFLVMWFMNP